MGRCLILSRKTGQSRALEKEREMAPTRRWLLGAFGLTAGAGMLELPFAMADPAALETATVRLVKDQSSCLAPQYVAETLLRDEGFKDISYVEVPDALDQEMIARGKADFALDFALKFIQAIDAGEPLTVLAGVHVGCFELFARNEIRNIRDLKGRTIGVGVIGGSAQAFIVSLGAAIGFDALRDIKWVTGPKPKPLDLFIQGEIDAFLAHPPEVQELRMRRIGHVVVSSTTDRPWSQYYCCMLGVNNEYLRKYPVATKSVVRALLRATDICGIDSRRAAREIVEHRAGDDYATALDVLRDIAYGNWREYDPADTLRYYALRLHEAGMIKQTPNSILQKGADWRFLDQVRRELKG
jgi:NitT/TauT family transport system substrate-binding protein